MANDAGGSNSEVNSLVYEFVRNFPVTHLLGIQISDLAFGKATIELPFREDLTFDGKTFQAGIVGVIADFAGAASAMSALPQGWAILSLGFEVHNIGTARGDSLTGFGEVIKPGKSHIVSRVDIFANRNQEKIHCGTALVTTRGFELPTRDS